MKVAVGRGTSSSSVMVVFCESSRPARREPNEEVGDEEAEGEDRLSYTGFCFQEN